MEHPVAIIIMLVALVILVLALYLVATIVELRQISAGLVDVLDGVGEIATKPIHFRFRKGKCLLLTPAE